MTKLPDLRHVSLAVLRQLALAAGLPEAVVAVHNHGLWHITAASNMLTPDPASQCTMLIVGPIRWSTGHNKLRFAPPGEFLNTKERQALQKLEHLKQLILDYVEANWRGIPAGPPKSKA